MKTTEAKIIPMKLKTQLQLQIQEILDDPAASHWLKNAFRTAVARDSVDAANDAEQLSRILAARADDELKTHLDTLHLAYHLTHQ